MKTKLFALAGLIAVIGSGTAYHVFAQTTPPTPAPKGGKMKGEKHPEMNKALKALQNAEKFLKSSAHDYDGHRAKALEDTENAIKEVQAGIASDTK